MAPFQVPEVRFQDGEDDVEEEHNGREVEPFGVEDRGLSLEELDDEMKEGAKIKWTPVDDPSKARATIGVAYDKAWKQAKIEIEFMRDKLEGACGSRHPPFDSIFDLIFGEESQVYKCLQEEKIFPDYDAYLQFLATFFLSSSYQVSTTQLFDKYSRIRTDGAAQKEEYKVAWRKLGNACLPSREDRNRNLTPPGTVPLWLKLETAMNNYMRELFIKDFPGQMQTTLDDDKPHVAGNKYTAGLKVMRHTNDNVNGHTLHTLVLSFSQVPAQITWERETNDSSQAATERIFSNGITPMAAPGQPGDLRHVSGVQDRGYWIRGLTHDYWMRSGAKILAATVMRQPSIGLTYQQDVGGNDTRVCVPVAGARTLITMKTVSHGRNLFCRAYRDGNGGVTLGLSTEHGAVPEWELVCAKPQDLKWYDKPSISKEEACKQAFKQLRLDFNPDRVKESDYVDLDPGFLETLKALPVQALTTTQGTPEWFLLRKFALTSSTIDQAIAACSGTEQWIENKSSWRGIKALLAGIPISQGATEDRDDEAEENDSDAATDQQGEDATATNEATAVKITLEGLLASEDLVQTAKRQIDYDEYNIEEVRQVLSDLGKSLSNANCDIKKVAADVKSYEIVLNTDPRLRKHIFQSKKVLVEMAKKVGLDERKLGKTQDSVRKAMAEFLESNPDAVIEAPKAKTKSKRSLLKEKIGKLSGQQRLLYVILRAGYMESLTGKAKKYTRRGHQLECHIMRWCIDELKKEDVDSPLQFEYACTAPLVKTNNNPHVRGSIDFLAVATTDGTDSFLVGVEIKARVANRTDQQAHRHVSEIRTILGQNRTARQCRLKYFTVEADTAEFRRVVTDTHEAIQVLHHAAVYELDRVLLLVGDNNGEVIYGLFVSVTARVRQLYNDCLKDIYKNALLFMYEDSTEPNMDAQQLKEVRDCIETKGATLDEQSLQMEMSLWRDVNNHFQFPIPRLKHIIPLLFALWNVLKGGSDATTNLLWHCMYSVPNNENQSIAIARMLSLAAVHVHRLHQIATAKPDLDKYSCLNRFRDSATQRSSFKKTQFQIIETITKRFVQEDAVPPTPERAPATAANSPPAARASRSQAHVQRLEVPLIQTNKTPKRSVNRSLEKMEARLESGKLDLSSRLVLERSKGCTGFPIKRLAADGDSGRGTCSVCGTATRHYCLYCKQWFCMTQQKAALKLEGFKKVVIINPNSASPLYVERTCFYHKHRANQEETLHNFATKASSVMANG